MVAALAALALIGASPAPAPNPAAASPDIAAACGTHDGWSDPAPPAHIHGRTWYVGTCGITVVLVKTNAGLVLIDNGPEDAAPLVLANIRALGFDPKQVKWLLSTHEHFDHAGGFAALQAATGTKLAVGPFAAQALRSGTPYPDDPQYEGLKAYPMKPARVDRVPCGISVTPHPSASNLHERLAGRTPLIDPAACRAYAQAGRERLAQRLAKEQSGQ